MSREINFKNPTKQKLKMEGRVLDNMLHTVHIQLTIVIKIHFKYILLIMLLQLSQFPPLPPLHPAPPQAIPPPLFMSMGHVYMLFGFSISNTVLYIPMAVL